MQKWEYCVVYVAEYRDGNDGSTRELLEIALPGAHRAAVTNPLGAVGLLNHLGNEGWELVDVEANRYFLKRHKAPAHHAQAL